MRRRTFVCSPDSATLATTAMSTLVSYTPDLMEAVATFDHVIVLDYHRPSIHPMMLFSMIAKSFLNAFRIAFLVSTYY